MARERSTSGCSAASRAATIGFMPTTRKRQPSTVCRDHAFGTLSTRPVNSQPAPHRLTRALTWPIRDAEQASKRSAAPERRRSDPGFNIVSWHSSIPEPAGRRRAGSKIQQRSPSPYPGARSARPVPRVIPKGHRRPSHGATRPSEDDDNNGGSSANNEPEARAESDSDERHSSEIISSSRLPPPDGGYFDARTHNNIVNDYYYWLFSRRDDPGAELEDCPLLESDDTDVDSESEITYTNSDNLYIYNNNLFKNGEDMYNGSGNTLCRDPQIVDADIPDQQDLSQRPMPDDRKQDKCPDKPMNAIWDSEAFGSVQETQPKPKCESSWLPTDPSYLKIKTPVPNGRFSIPLLKWTTKTELTDNGLVTFVSSARPPEECTDKILCPTSGMNWFARIPSHTPVNSHNLDTDPTWGVLSMRLDPQDLKKRLIKATRCQGRTGDSDADEDQPTTEHIEDIAAKPPELKASPAQKLGDIELSKPTFWPSTQDDWGAAHSRRFKNGGYSDGKRSGVGGLLILERTLSWCQGQRACI